MLNSIMIKNGSRIFPVPIVSVLFAMLLGFSIQAESATECPSPSAGNSDYVVVDGAFTDTDEWAGYCVFSTDVSSVYGKFIIHPQIVHNGQGQFVFFTICFLHYFWFGCGDHFGEAEGYNRLDTYDLNYFEVILPDERTIQAWVFQPGDFPSDEGSTATDYEWVQKYGLLNSPYYKSDQSFNDDGGFLVRLNRDPATDKRWLEDDPEPGQAAWNFDDYHGVFARAGFNDSAVQYGYDADPVGQGDYREIYEFTFSFIWQGDTAKLCNYLNDIVVIGGFQNRSMDGSSLMRKPIKIKDWKCSPPCEWPEAPFYPGWSSNLSNSFFYSSSSSDSVFGTFSSASYYWYQYSYLCFPFLQY